MGSTRLGIAIPPGDKSGEGTYLELCSRSIQSAATDIGHGKSESTVTPNRKSRSRSAGISGHDRSEYAPTQLTALGFGEYRPTQSNVTVEGRAANRRVMLAILAPERAGQNLYSAQGLAAGLAGEPTTPMSLTPATVPSALPKAPPR